MILRLASIMGAFVTTVLDGLVWAAINQGWLPGAAGVISAVATLLASIGSLLGIVWAHQKATEERRAQRDAEARKQELLDERERELDARERSLEGDDAGGRGRSRRGGR